MNETEASVMRAIRAVRPEAVELLEDNPNVMDEPTFRALVEGIQLFGFMQPILVRRQGEERLIIVDGHHRVRAALELGLVFIPAVVADSEDEAGVFLRIMMNRVRGDLDQAKVAKQLGALAEAGWTVRELAGTGFSEAEVRALISTQKTDEIDPMGGGVDAPPEDGDDDKPAEDGKVHSFELVFVERKDMLRLRKALRKAGDGDPAKGLITWEKDRDS